MTNQLNLTYQNNVLNLNRLWWSSILVLSFLVLITLWSSVTELPASFNLSNMALCLLFMVAILLVKFKRKQVPFVKIEGQQLQYFCPVKKALVMIPANEITSVTTQFCELQIHTTGRTHCLNMNKVKQEKQRWEIKEMIRKLAVENGNRMIINDRNKAS